MKLLVPAQATLLIKWIERHRDSHLINKNRHKKQMALQMRPHNLLTITISLITC